MILLGIDIGGTGIKGAPVDIETGKLAAERFRIPTPQPSLPNAVADVVGQIAEHFNYKGPAGITFPAIVKSGVIYSAANVDKSWIGTNGNQLFSAHTGGPVEVVNDADAAGIAEMRFGAGRGRNGVVILLTLGTGIGSAIFLDGKLVPNTEFGHLKIRGKDAEKRASERIREEKDLTWKQWSKHLSEFLVELEKLFSPDLFIIGGGVSKKAAKFLPYLTTKTEVLIVPAQMQNEAGIIGAAYLAKHLAEGA
jgi:Transcriptional regulator/sugar kinase